MGRALFLAALLSCLAHGAIAQEWSIAGFARERFEADTNRTLAEESSGAVFGSRSTLNLNFGLATQRATWSVIPQFTINAFTGPGNTENIQRIDPDIRANMGYEGKRFSLGFNTRYDRRSVSFTEFDEDGGVDGDGLDINSTAVRESFDLAGNYTYRLDNRNTLSLNGFGRVLRFSEDDDDFTPSNTAGGGFSWSRAISPRTSLSLSASTQRLKADNRTDTESLSNTVTVGISRTLTPRLSFSASGGISATRQSFDVITPFGVAGRTTTNEFGGVGNLSAVYELQKTRLGLRASQSIRPSASGELQTRTGASFDLSHSINDRSRFALRSGFSRRTSATTTPGGDGATGFFILSPSYTYALNRDWDASVSYRFRMAIDDDSTAFSNAVILGITRELRLFP